VTTVKVAYFLKSLPTRLSTFIYREIDYLRARGDEVYLLPVWDTDEPDLPETVTARPGYVYARFSLTSPGWIGALARFALTRPVRTARVFRDYRRPLGIKFVLKSLEAARFVHGAGIERIHAHTLSLAASRARACSLLLGIPYTLTVHGSDLLLLPPSDARRLLLDAAALITPTRYNRAKIESLTGGPTGTVRVIPSPVDTDFFTPPPAPRRAGPTRLITVGRLHPIKGHELIIEALRLLAGRGAGPELTIVGGGEMDLPLRRRVSELGLDGRVAFTGVLLDEALRDRLADSDVFVMASGSEGLPVALLEAMAMGLAVVVPAITGIPEVIRPGENGLLFTPDDPADLARKLDAVVSDAALRRRLGSAARRTALSRFGREEVYDETARLIRGAEPQR
jgi:colanic acid/amylovoran biosynthesis glycosyltransferase